MSGKIDDLGIAPVECSEPFARVHPLPPQRV